MERRHVDKVALLLRGEGHVRADVLQLALGDLKVVHLPLIVLEFSVLEVLESLIDHVLLDGAIANSLGDDLAKMHDNNVGRV